MRAALAAGIHPVEALVDAERRPELEGLEEAEPVEPRLLAEVSGLAHPPRVLAIFRRADLPQARSGRPTFGRCGALACCRSGQRRNDTAGGGRTRPCLRGALRRLRRPDRRQGATRVGRRDLPRAARAVRRGAAAAGRARRARRTAALPELELPAAGDVPPRRRAGRTAGRRRRRLPSSRRRFRSRPARSRSTSR